MFNWQETKEKAIKALRESGLMPFKYEDCLYMRHGEIYKGELKIVDEILVFMCTQCGKNKKIPNYGYKKLPFANIKCPCCGNDSFFLPSNIADH